MLSRIFIVSILALLTGASASAQSRRDGSGVAPPPVVSQSVAVKRGEKVVVPLAIHGARGERLEFVIRTLPSHGRLSAVTPSGLNSATVVYTPSGRGSPAEDRFAYAVRGSEGVSAPGLVTLKFIDPPIVPPSLRAPAELEFPSVFAGQRSVVDLELVNDGGGFAEGEVTVQAPWAIEGISIFRLGGGQRATFRILFKSDKVGITTGDATIAGTARKRIPLHATVEDRLSATPPLLKLIASSGSQTRKGTIQISNRSDEDASVSVACGPRLITDRRVNVPARGKVEMPVFADAGDAGAFDETVRLSSDNWAATVAVRAIAVGAIVKFAGDRVRIAGSAGGISASGSATVENSGGEAATVRLDIDPPFELDARVITVPGRGSAEIPIRASRAAAGSYRASLRATGEGASAAVEVTAELAAQNPVAPPAREIPRGERTEAVAAPDPAEPLDDSLPWMPMTLQEMPNGMGSFARQTGDDSFVLEWPAGLGVPADVRFEERVMSITADEQLKIDWAPLANVRAAVTGDRMSAELRRLKPRSLYTVRAVSGQGDDLTTWFTSEFWTPPVKPLIDIGWRTPALVLALGFLAFSIWRSRRSAKR